MSRSAKRFYQSHGFIASPIDPMTVMITVTEAVKTLSEKTGK